ncbi:MAG: hypothetical protein V1810_00890 [Candidatus Beckwithbacteria bacterium]
MSEEGVRQEGQSQRQIPGWAGKGGVIKISGETVERYANIFKKNPKRESSPAQERRQKAKRNSKIISATLLGGTALAVASQVIKGSREGQEIRQETTLTPNAFGDGSESSQEQITQNQYADYDFMQIGNIGLERTGINLENLDNPETLINKPFLRLVAKFGDDFLIPPEVSLDGKIIQEVSEAVVADWVNALHLNSEEAADFRGNYVFYRTHSEEFGKFLLEHGASQTIVDLLLKAEELKTQDTDPASWYGGAGNPSDRYEKLQQWLLGEGIVIGKTEGKMVLPRAAKVKWGNEVRIPRGELGLQQEMIANSYLVETAGSFGINAQEVLGNMATLQAELAVNQRDGDGRYKTLEMARAALPEEMKVAGGNSLATNIDVATMWVLGVMAVAGFTRPRLEGLFKDKTGDTFKEVTAKLVEIGKVFFGKLTDDERRVNNVRRLVNRLKNGLSLSREFVFDLGEKLMNPDDQDMKDLITIEGPNWFRFIQEDHPEAGQIIRFFGCKDYEDLQNLAIWPNLIAQRLRELLPTKIREYAEKGRGRERGNKVTIRKPFPENERLIELYRLG